MRVILMSRTPRVSNSSMTRVSLWIGSCHICWQSANIMNYAEFFSFCDVLLLDEVGSASVGTHFDRNHSWLLIRSVPDPSCQLLLVESLFDQLGIDIFLKKKTHREGEAFKLQVIENEWFLRNWTEPEFSFIKF